MTPADKFRAFMLHEIGEPYVWGDEGKGGPGGKDAYDCSGLFWAAMQYAGFDLERMTAHDYYKRGERIGRPSRVGDYGVMLNAAGHATHIISYIGTKRGQAVEVEARGKAYGVVLYSVAQANKRGAVWMRLRGVNMGELSKPKAAGKLDAARAWLYWHRYKGNNPVIGPKPTTFELWRTVDRKDGTSPWMRFWRTFN